MSLDNGPLLDADNNPLSLRQGDFIPRFNALNKIMASMPDLYEAGKNADNAVIKSLRKDFNDTWEISSTRISYENESLEGTITHYFGSTVIEPDEKRLIIPPYNGESLDKVLKEEQGLVYLQALFNTNDNAEEIKDTLQKLSGKKSNKIKVWTPDQSSRASNQNRAAGLGYGGDVFLVVGDNYLGRSGRSRGVRMEEPPKAAR